MKEPTEVGSQPQPIIHEEIEVDDRDLPQEDTPADGVKTKVVKKRLKVRPEGIESRRKRVIKKRPEEKEEPRKSSLP